MPPVLFTSLNAREMSLRGQAARKAKRQNELDRLKLIDALLAESAKPKPEPPKPVVKPLELPIPEQDEYPVRVLMRVRNQLDLVAGRISEELARPEPDSRRIRDLTDAQTKLSEQERVLAGRPLPGSRRPVERRSKGGSWSEGPLSAPSLAPAPVDLAAPPIQPPPAAPAAPDSPTHPD